MDTKKTVSLVQAIDHFYKSLRNSKKIDIVWVERGYGIYEKLLNDHSIILNLVRDVNEKLSEEIKILKNKRIRGSTLLSLTFKPLDLTWKPYKQVTFFKGGIGVDKNLVFMYPSICPEIENFISVVLWGSSESSALLFNKIKQLLDSDDLDSIITVEGGYSLLLPTELHPDRLEKVKTTKIQKNYYTWSFVPYIKRTSDSLFRKTSPANFFPMVEHSKLEFVNFKSVIGFVDRIRGDQILLYVPNGKGFFDKCDFYIHHNIIEKCLSLKSDTLGYFLIREVIEGRERIIRNEVFDFDDGNGNSLDINDIVHHIIHHNLYGCYLRSDSLCVMNIEKYLKMVNFVRMNVSKGIKKHNGNYTIGDTLSSKLSIDIDLRPSFRKINNSVFYIPKILDNMKEEDIILINGILEEKEISSPKYTIENGLNEGKSVREIIAERMSYNKKISEMRNIALKIRLITEIKKLMLNFK